jgi:hypothetical protein
VKVQKQQKTLSEAIGEANASQLIAYFAEEKKLKDIISLMPNARFTIGRLVSIRRRYKEEIKCNVEVLKMTELIAPREVRRPPLKKGAKSNVVEPRASLGEEREMEIIDTAVREWLIHPQLKKASAFAAMCVNKARIAAGIKVYINADKVEDMLDNAARKARAKKQVQHNNGTA